jgi:hypothetical protein
MLASSLLTRPEREQVTIDITLLRYCCYAVTIETHCCYTVVTLLLHCCDTVFTLLLHYYRSRRGRRRGDTVGTLASVHSKPALALCSMMFGSLLSALCYLLASLSSLSPLPSRHCSLLSVICSLISASCSC